MAAKVLIISQIADIVSIFASAEPLQASIRNEKAGSISRPASPLDINVFFSYQLPLSR